MKIRRFYGKDMREALKQVKDELGDDAVIMSNKKLSNGVEIVAAYDKEPAVNSKRAESNLTPAPKRRAESTPTLSEIIGDSGPDSLRALLEKQIQAKESAHQVSQPVAQPAKPQNGTSQSQRQTQAQPQVPNVSHQQDALNEMRQELASLRNVLQFQVAGLLQQDKGRNHPLHGYLTNKLQKMGISEALANEVVSYTPADTDERQAWLFLLKLLANRIQTEENNLLTKGGIAVLMGPTGTGKTTTVAKLAAQAAQKYGAENVGLITIDSYRIAAYEQISTYARIIGCSVKKAQNAEELSDLLFQFRNKRLILIDTAGFGQRDVRLIKQLETLKQSTTANISSYLVMQANSQYQVMQQTIAAYKQISLQGCIFTKIDECYSLGEAISAAIEHKLSVSFITDGQKVPEDLKVADAKFLITSAAKLYKKHVLIHTSGNSLNNAAVAV
ncbi:flagellar biosynthesis protein FlhF [Paraglaciecola mesophila]|uniref:Flagellar biosynthesis protein FlhF n=1 Tax=Paraglaciecola mesophila TaxID=197222 RepID=A0ABU9STI5_9ALTE